MCSKKRSCLFVMLKSSNGVITSHSPPVCKSQDMPTLCSFHILQLINYQIPPNPIISSPSFLQIHALLSLLCSASIILHLNYWLVFCSLGPWILGIVWSVLSQLVPCPNLHRTENCSIASNLYRKYANIKYNVVRIWGTRTKGIREDFLMTFSLLMTAACLNVTRF